MKIGDKVSHINNNLEGKVINIYGNQITFLSKDGFEYSYDKKQLVLIGEELNNVLSKQKIIKKDFSKVKNRKKNIKIPEFDLHIEKIQAKHHHLDVATKLQIQLEEVNRIINKMKRSHYKEIILIHGHGKNVLRKKVIEIIKNKGFVYFDASFQKYGGGAIQVKIK